MASNHQGPLWNENLVLAMGLAFAGMFALQGKLFAAAGRANLEFLNTLWAWKGLEWWPVLLIASGVVLWVRKARANSSTKHVGSARAGGNK